MSSADIEFQANKLVSYFVNMDNNILRIAIGLIVVLFILSLTKKAIKTAVTLVLIAAIFVGCSWVKTSIIDENNIKINDTYIEINGSEFEFNELRGFEVDDSDSELIVKTTNGDIGVKINSNLDGVNSLLNLIGN